MAGCLVPHPPTSRTRTPNGQAPGRRVVGHREGREPLRRGAGQSRTVEGKRGSMARAQQVVASNDRHATTRVRAVGGERAEEVAWPTHDNDACREEHHRRLAHIWRAPLRDPRNIDLDLVAAHGRRIVREFERRRAGDRRIAARFDDGAQRDAERCLKQVTTVTVYWCSHGGSVAE